MKVIAIVLLPPCILLSGISMAQRFHEIQFQFGVSLNKGVSYYDYFDSDQNRHNFEFDQRLKSVYYRINWLVPVNGYIETGLYFSNSLDTKHRFIEAESILFDSIGVRKGASTLFTGESDFDSNAKEIGINLKICLARIGKLKAYALINPGWLRIKVFKNDPSNVLQAEDEGLRQDLFDTYVIKDDLFVISYCLGLSYRMAPGFTFTIIEVSGKSHPGVSRLITTTPTVDIRTGLSYQFYRRK